MKNIFYRILITFFSVLYAQNIGTHYDSDPYFLLISERNQFSKEAPIQSNIFKPIFFNTDSIAISISLKNQFYYNDNAPNQENMDVRYFSKGLSNFSSIQFSQ